MKAYKATYNFKCLNQEYKVGKTYTSDKMNICNYGIHYCQNMKNVLNYYTFNKDFVLLEIEILGTVETVDDKSVTDKIKVLRVVPFEEYTFKDKLPALEYDEKGNMISEKYPNGRKYTYEYDEKGNMISQTYPYGRKYTYEYDEKGNMISETYPYGDKYTWEYDENGNKISETSPYGSVWTYEYDEKGNKISATSPKGDKYTYEYDEKGNMIFKTSTQGDKYTWEYDENGNKISQTSPDGSKYTYVVALITESSD